MLRSRTLPQLPNPNRTRADALTWFDSRRGANGLDDPDCIRLLDYQKRAIHLTRQTVETHLKGKYLAAGRQNILDRIPEVLASPDEVYLVRGGRTGTSYDVHYIKFYQNTPMIVPVTTAEEDGISFRATTCHTLEGDVDVRRAGILLKKS